jgi:hypothetical protein
MPAEPVTRAPAAARELLARLAGVRRRHQRTVVFTALAAAAAGLLAWLSAGGLLDYLTMLPWSWRLAILLAVVAGLGLLLWRLAWLPLRAALSDDAVALMIERGVPAFRSRCIAAVQLARGSAPPALVGALVAEATALARTERLDAALDLRPLRRARKYFAAAVLVAVPLAWLGGEKTAPLVRRAFLSREPVPRQTRIAVIEGPRTLAVGDDFLLAARVGGAVPKRGKVTLALSGGRKQEFPFEPEAQERTRFSRLLRSVQETFDFTIHLGDARTEPQRVRVKPRPAVVSIDAQQIFPAYTAQQPERRSMTALKLLAGSKLALRVKANTKLRSAAVRLVGVEQEAPLAVEGWGRTEAAGAVVLPAKDVTGLQIRLVDADGVESRSPTTYRVELVPDAPPTIKLLTPPRREELLTAGATMLLAFEAHDDFGIARARLHYAVDWQEGAPHQTIDLDLAGQRPRDLVRRFEWKIGQLQPPVGEGQVIDYWIEIADANDVTGPGLARLEHHQARIVSELEKRAELAARLSDAMQGLDEARRGQERVSESLGEFIFEKPPGAP